MDHRGEPPSWTPGAAAVGTGAGPPDLDETDDSQLGGGPAYAAGPEDSDAPGFADLPVTGSGFGPAEPDGPGFGDAPAEAPDFADAPDFGREFPEAPDFTPRGGYGEAPAEAAPGFEDAPAFGGSNGPPFQGGPGAHPGFAPPGQQPWGGAGDPVRQGFTGGRQDISYDGPYTGQFRGDYGGGGYRTATQQDRSLQTAPGMGAMYGGEQAYVAGNGGTRTQEPGYPPPYPPPSSPPRSRLSGMTASLRAVRRPKVSKPEKARSRKRGRVAGRQAQLTVSRVEPWSVMKFSFVISLVAFIVLFVAVAVLYWALSSLGVFTALQHTVTNITSSQGSSGFNLMRYISASRVLGYTGLLGAINVVLITALSTVGAVLYNITADLAGGVEITLKESD